ncbi:MAG: phosphoribosylamine--glycine ligase [Armatimonadetes bacterium]|nr:phosphoribosylamine--glycine ligase [Armatimonadota bacterium]
MKLLIIGSGGREHTLAWKLAQSDKVKKLYAWPGNAGIGAIAERVGGSVMDIKGIADFAEQELIDLTVVGPESPLIVGLADEIEKRGLKVYGPNREAAQMEGSKVFAKRLMLDNGIPTADCEVFDDPAKASAYIESVASKSNDPIVVKADGEAAGKGVFVSKTKDDALQAVDVIMNQRAFGASGNRLVVEEFLDGPEASFMCFVDGETFVPMVPAQDYKRAYDNDEGPNTGGMGCYAPVPVVTDAVNNIVKDSVVKPTLKALKKMGIHYRGVLYVGLALTSKGPKVVEFNARFGDPETQVVLPLLQSDLVDIMLASINGKLDTAGVSWYNRNALCVVMASGGYPGGYQKGKVITGIDEAEKAGVMVFHAGTEVEDNNVVTSGGRVLGVTAVNDTYEDCIRTAYTGVGKINFAAAHFRHDIGARLIK